MSLFVAAIIRLPLRRSKLAYTLNLSHLPDCEVVKLRGLRLKAKALIRHEHRSRKAVLRSGKFDRAFQNKIEQ